MMIFSSRIAWLGWVLALALPCGAQGQSWNPDAARSGYSSERYTGGDWRGGNEVPPLGGFRYQPDSGRYAPGAEETPAGYSGYVEPTRRGRSQDQPGHFPQEPSGGYRFREPATPLGQQEKGDLRYRPDSRLADVPYTPGLGLPDWHDAQGVPPVFRPLDDRRPKRPSNQQGEIPQVLTPGEYLFPSRQPYAYPGLSDPAYVPPVY